MHAMIRIGPRHVGHASGSTSKICGRRAAQRRAASGGVGRRQPWRGDDGGRPVRGGGRRFISHAAGAVGVPAVIPRGDVALVTLMTSTYVAAIADARPMFQDDAADLAMQMTERRARRVIEAHPTPTVKSYAMRRILLCCVLTTSPIVASAQPHPIIGQWHVSIETLVPPDNGAPTTIYRKGLLSVAQAGDSLIATLALDSVPGLPTPKAERLAAQQRDGTVSFVKTAEASLSGNGDVLSRTAIITYAFEVQSQRLAGTMHIQLAGIPNIPPRAITGTRAK